MSEKLSEACNQFFPGDFNFTPVESGHINRTFIAREEKSGKQFILQALNTNVFKNYNAVVSNYEKVATYCLEIIPTLINSREGNSFLKIENELWRAFEFVENTRTITEIENENQAYEGARMFGTFIERCASIDAATLEESIPGFHDVNNRIEKFKIALNKDSFKRANSIKNHIPVLDKFYPLGKDFRKANENLPSRVVHNDTKPSNILFAQDGDKAIKVIDLDTVMPGLLISDFGDMVRSFTPAGKEDDPHPASSEVRKEVYEALNEGFLESTNSFMKPEEKMLLNLGAKSIIFEQSLRFFTDYLEGDVYYKTTREHQNLDRAIHQLNILKSV